MFVEVNVGRKCSPRYAPILQLNILYPNIDLLDGLLAKFSSLSGLTRFTTGPRLSSPPFVSSYLRLLVTELYVGLYLSPYHHGLYRLLRAPPKLPIIRAMLYIMIIRTSTYPVLRA